MQEFLQNKLQDRLISFNRTNQGRIPINDIGSDSSVTIEMIVTKAPFPLFNAL